MSLLSSLKKFSLNATSGVFFAKPKTFENFRKALEEASDITISINVGAITSPAFKHYDRTATELRAFNNVDYITGFSVDNNSPYAIKVMLDYSRKFLIPKLTMKTYDRLAFKSISVEAHVGNISDGEVYLTPIHTKKRGLTIGGAR